MVVERTDPAVKRSRCFVFLKKFCHVTARHYFRTETYEIRRLFIGSGHAHFVDFLVYLPTGCKVFPPREICPDTLFRVELDAICQFVGCFLENFLASLSLPHGPDSIFDWPLVDTATDAPPGHAPPPWRPPRQLTNASVFFHRGI